MTSVSSLSSAAISSQISTVETRLQAPITKLNTQVTTDKAEISAWGSISGMVSNLSNSLSNIKNVATINSRIVNSTATTVATATVDSTAATGTYNLTNITLAKPQEIYSSLLGSGASTLSGGTGSLVVSLQNGKSETISVGSGSLTLNGVAAAINKQAGGVKASVIGTAAGARLVMQSSGTGSASAFSVSGTGALAQFDYNPSSAHIGETLAQAAADASLTMNGVPIISATNTLGSAVSGVTISLAGSGNAVVSVSSSPTGLSTAVQAVATNLNAAISAIAKMTKFVATSSASASSSSNSSSTTAKSGPLLGNFTATELQSKLTTSVSQLVASGVSAGAAGLSITSSGAVKFNASSFASEYAKNPTAVQKLVSDLYSTLDTVATGAIGSAAGNSTSTASSKNTGSIGAQTASLNAMITSINSQVTQISKWNAAQLKILLSQYTVAESAATSASITQTYLNVFTSTSSSSG